MVNEARVGFNRLNVDFGGNSIGPFPRHGVGDALPVLRSQATGFSAGWRRTNLPQSPHREHLAGTGQLELRYGQAHV